MKNFVTKALLLITVTAISCVEPIKIKGNKSGKNLVVEGWITNNDGPHVVQLNYLAEYRTGYEGVNFGVKAAKVSILDDLGNETNLVETEGGRYASEPGKLLGMIGRSYKLRIKLGEEIYESLYEKLEDVPPIDSIYSEYNKGNEFSAEGFDVFINTKDPANEKNYYKWSWESYDPIIYCEIRELGSSLTAVPCCTYCNSAPCFDVKNCYNCFILQSDRYLEGNTLEKKYITTIPYTTTVNASVKITQQSLTKEAYIYYTKVNAQANNTGGAFDAPPFVVEGNISNVGTKDDLVLGYFGASALHTKYALVKRTNISSSPRQPIFDTIKTCFQECYPCIESSIRTRATPPGWRPY